MSLTRIVTVHCDRCGEWEFTEDNPAADRARRGWQTNTGEDGYRRDLCPKCTKPLASTPASGGEA